MKILLSSYAFYPSIGGIESVSELLAAEFVRLGHEVRIITQSQGADREGWGYEVLRNPGVMELLRAVRWCDVFFHNNISLQLLWPLLLVRRPWVVTHQTWITRLDRSLNWRDRLKRLLLRRAAANVSISRAVAESIPVPSRIIPNPYQDDLFYRMPEVMRKKDVVFLGRLVSDKGVDLLIEAVKLLKEGGVTVSVTIVGSGPEEKALHAQAHELGIAPQIDFVGPKRGMELARILNAHRILAVPSRWAEPFGIVALEGLACGCVVVGSQEGGLPDAIGPCGLTFPNGNAQALACALREALTSPGLLAQLQSGAAEHLARHTALAVATEYLEIFQRALR